MAEIAIVVAAAAAAQRRQQIPEQLLPIPDCEIPQTLRLTKGSPDSYRLNIVGHQIEKQTPRKIAGEKHVGRANLKQQCCVGSGYLAMFLKVRVWNE